MAPRYEKISSDDGISRSPTLDVPFSDLEAIKLHPDEVSLALEQVSKKSSCFSLLLKTLLYLILVLAGFAVGWASHRTGETPCLDTAWNDIREAMQFETVQWNPREEGVLSEYMGKPGSALDEAWDSISQLWNFGVKYEALVKLNRTRGAVRYPGTDLYQVGLEAYHQLHCLNYIRKYTSKDYYKTIDEDMVAENETESLEHKDHCIEVLRQRLMCVPDLNVYTYHWVDYAPNAYGNLYTEHRCMDWDHFHNWTMGHTIHISPFEKPADTDVWVY